MVASADGGSAVAGLSGGLGNRDDHAVFTALREGADAVIVGMSTTIAEQYHPPPASSNLQILVVASRPEIAANATLFASSRVTLVLPDDPRPAPDGVSELRAGAGGRVDLSRLLALLEGKVVMVEGGPTLAGTMMGLGLVDEFFLTVAAACDRG